LNNSEGAIFAEQKSPIVKGNDALYFKALTEFFVKLSETGTLPALL
jgi:hypothetical protein